ncbi:hypothetical protein VNI00_008465 [Paramarasmius palmivorus]|uniref:SAP domain-containing protein n=1 Tax=Paramarasmius palmivorus TaxID=297713 RepID=A0AAW0CTI0_9AGAR
MGRRPNNIPQELWEKKYELPGFDESEAEEAYLYQLTLPQLKVLCSRYKSYGLRVSGKKPDLLESLVRLSDEKSRWTFKQPAKRTHKGLQPGTRKTSTKRKYKQRLEEKGVIFTESSHTKHIRGMRKRTEAEMDTEMDYIDRYMALHPEYYQPMQPTPQISVEPKPSLVAQIGDVMETKLHQFARSIGHHSLTDVVTEPQPMVLPSLSSFLPPPPVPAPLSHSNAALPPPPSTPSISHSHLNLIDEVSTSTQTPRAVFSASAFQSSPEATTPLDYPSASMDNPLSTAQPRIKTLRIWVGTPKETVLVFDQTQLPEPPSLTFCKDLDELGRLWCETNPGFCEDECVLKISGRGIAYQHWRNVFKHGSKTSPDTRWEGLRKKWDVWRVIGVYYTAQGKEAFWNEFTVDGSRLRQTAILEILCARSPNSTKGLNGNGKAVGT